MYKIKILSIGKTKERWLEQGMLEYIKRLKPTAKIEYHWTKDEDQLMSLAEKEPFLICLDPQGKTLTSEEFSGFLLEALESGGSRLTFLIGGAEGIPASIKKSATLVSLSKLTFTHQLSRLILLEQLYRGFEIAKGSSYHK
jgi:23S rRNA (pseudouridine1915-N3)-methyltransferase